ncbi:hypothetical protein [Xanthomonas sacchari]|uniref:hypothetical protein n=1 Tax=Xanthomonas sacchari TaxID=56458 RepID=UPI00225B9239|nr:hypothetical protein [Xanthomonas sacchari]MCW0370238.1 hypothetical protein [Xanthomonas sacchari]
MRASHIFRLLCCGIVVGFLADLLRRCVIVEAWSVGPVVAALLVLALIATRRAWRTARRSHRKRVAFIRPKTPDFPAQPKRDIR